MPYADAQKRAEYLREWRRKNANKLAGYRAKYLKEHRDRQRAAAKKYRQANKSKYAGYALRRLARKASVAQGDPDEAVAYENILRQGVCEQCGSREPVHIDHIEPLVFGGEHGWENFAGLCKSCNSHKHDRPLLFAMIA